MVEGAQLYTTGSLLTSLSIYICRCVFQNCCPLYLQWVQEAVSWADWNAVAVLTWGLRVAASAVWCTRGSDVEAGIEEHIKPGAASTVNTKLEITLVLYFLPVVFHRLLQPKWWTVTSAFWSDPFWTCSSRCFRGSNVQTALQYLSLDSEKSSIWLGTSEHLTSVNFCNYNWVNN